MNIPQALLVPVLLGAVATGVEAQPLAFGSESAVVFTRVHVNSVEDFEAILSQAHELLKKSDNPVRRQQAEGWKVFRTVDQATGGIAIYVSVITPVVKSADYDLSTIFEEELNEKDAKAVNARLVSCLAAPPFSYPIDLVTLPNFEPVSMKARATVVKPTRHP
jgi:hypothetical protein